MDNYNTKNHVFVCFIIVSPFVGIRCVEVIDEEADLDQLHENEIRYKILLSDEFMQNRGKPVFECVADMYSYDTALMLIVVLLQFGVQQGQEKYELLMLHKYHDTMHEFASEFILHNTESLQNFMEIYGSLCEVFDQEYVDQFMIDMLLYGASAVKDIPEAYVFGPIGYAARN